MSLRGRVIALTSVVLLVSAAIYFVIAWRSAQRDLAAELDAARRGGLQTVRSAFEDLPHSDHRNRDLRQLVATFEGNRHVRALVIDWNDRVRLASDLQRPSHPAPQWFASALSPRLEPTVVVIPGNGGMRIELVPQPESDLAVLWSAMVSAAGVFATAAIVGLALIYLVIGRALAPISELARGLAGVGAGAYGQRIREEGPPELLGLQRGFNAMAERLQEIAGQNRALEAQLLTIQDEERAEIARDLHDEIGPHLFAVALDAEMIGRSAASADIERIPEQVRSIQSAVSYMQRQVRDLIARLRPTRATELGLHAALLDLVAFWHARQPQTVFGADVDLADSLVPEPLRDVIYRVVQEALANAVRHADCREIAVSVRAEDDALVVAVRNNGHTREIAAFKPGLGLVSMRERVYAAGGALQIDRASEGWTVEARFQNAITRATMVAA